MPDRGCNFCRPERRIWGTSAAVRGYAASQCRVSEVFMHRRFWTNAAVASCFVLFATAASFLPAAEQPLSQRSQSSAKSAPLMVTAGETTPTAPVTGTDDSLQPATLPAL